jgi:hypothetical protein
MDAQPQPELIVRTLRIDDPDILFLDHIRLRQEAIAKYPDKILATSYNADPAFIRNQIGNNYLCIALAILDGETIGTLTMIFPTEIKRRHKAALSVTYVDKPPRIREKLARLNMQYAHGVGYRLKKHMLSEARARGYETVIAQSSTAHDTSRDINLALGAKLMWTEPRGMKLEDGTYVDVYTFEFDVTKEQDEQSGTHQGTGHNSASIG